jgi:hypothetical protein
VRKFHGVPPVQNRGDGNTTAAEPLGDWFVFRLPQQVKETGMHTRTAAVALSVAIAFAGSAWACGADKTTKIDTKQQTAATQPVKQDVLKKKGG